jgi:hypothetical protein
MNGGVADTVGRVTADELHAACSGYRKFGFIAAASLIEAACKLSREERRGREREFDKQYATAVGEDSTIMARFHLHYINSKFEYAPLGEEATPETKPRKRARLQRRAARGLDVKYAGNGAPA